MPDPNTSVMFMPDESPAPAAPKTYSREALVQKGMSKGWDRERAEAAADVKLARETSKVWESAATGEDFSAVAKRAGELVPDVYTAPEEVSSMPGFSRQKVELPTTTASAPRVESTRFKERPLRPMSELTPQEIRSIDVAKRAREDAAAAEAYEGATTPSKLFPAVGFAMGGPAGAAFGAGAGAVAKPLASGVSRLLGRIGTEEPTVTELMLRMPDEQPAPAATSVPTPDAATRALLAQGRAPSGRDLSTNYDLMGNIPMTGKEPEQVPDIAYSIPKTSIPSDVMDFAKERATDFLFSSMALPVAVSDTLMDIYAGAKDVPTAIGRGLEGYSELAKRSSEQNVIKPLGKAPTLEQIAKNTETWDIIPTQGNRERATNARMFQQAPEKVVPLGNYNLDQSLFDVIDTPEGAVEKGLDTTPGFQMWEKEHPVRAQQARETVAAQRAERAPAERAAQRQEVRQKTVEDYLSANILPAIEKMKDYNLTPDEYRALQVAGAFTGRQTEEGDIELAGGDGGARVREMLTLKKEDPATFAALVAALPKGP